MLKQLASAALGACMFTALPAQAQMFKDAALDALFSAERFDDLGRAGTQRLAAQPDDTQGLLAAGIAALRSNDGTRRQGVIGLAEACVQRQPQAAACHYVLGAVLGVHAASEGMMKLASSVGTVKASLLQAMALEPGWYPARAAVVEFYTVAPGLVGGSTSKALEAARAAPRPDQARALEARIALQDGKLDSALATLAEIKPGSDSALAADLVAWQRFGAFQLMRDKQPDKARAVLERAQREHPDAAWPVYGLARVATDTGNPAEAVKLFEQAGRLKGNEELPIGYRAGIAYAALGQKEAARAAFTRFISAGKGAKNDREDAKKRLDALGS